MIVGVAVGGGGISTEHITALALQLAFFGLATGAVALALGAATGRRPVAAGGAAGVAILGWLVSSFAPLVEPIAWLKYLTLFYYYAGHDPLTHGIGLSGLIVLGFVTLVLTGVAILSFDRRDLRA
jgi:ABC-2 type transport system permease protein